MAKAGKRINYDLNDRFLSVGGHIYTKNSAKNLRFWCRMTTSSPTDLSNSSLSPTYDNSPAVSTVALGNKKYFAVTTNDSANQAAEVTSASGLLSFNSTIPGNIPAAGSDRPFSVSLWVKLDNLSSLNALFAKKTNLQYEYKAEVEQTTGKLYFYLLDYYLGDAAFVESSAGIIAGAWYFLTFTYDGRGGNTAASGLKIYVNGTSVSLNTFNNVDYVGMSSVFNQPLYIAQDYSGNNELDGQISEFAVWGSELTADEVLAIYNATIQDAYVPQSGVISNPSRILLQEKDNHTGSYPAIARTGDHDFLGKFPSTFDDTKIINFAPSNVLYPTVLPSNSFWINEGVATPNALQGLSAAGAAIKGISDSHITFTPGENIRPFEDNRVYIDNNAQFYQTGTNEEVLPAFNQRLSSKTIISLDINPTVATDVFFSTGTTGDYDNNSDSNISSGLAYFNWYKKKWELIGDTREGIRTGSNVDIFNPNPSIRSSAPHPAGGVPQFGMSSPTSNTSRHVGIFHSTHGFPFASQYDSTGSQELSLTSSLSAPFLLEKAVLEWSGSFAKWPNATLEDGPLCYQFFLLNIAPVNDSVSIVQDLTGSSSGIAGTFTTRNASFQVNKVKDLVWSGIVSRYYSALTGTVPTKTYERDLNLVKLGVNGSGIGATTGTFRLETVAGIYGKNEGLHTHALRDDTVNVPLLSNKIGFRNFAGYTEGKSFIRPIAAINPSGSFTAEGTDSSKKYSISFIPSSDIRRDSPYVLLPHHKLVLGFYGVPIQGTGGDIGDPKYWSEEAAKSHVTTLAPGLGRLTLYGSLLRNNLPVSPETNQPLTSDAVHEDLHFDNPVFDQFDVEPFEFLTGSYVDLIITGSMLASKTGDPFAVNTRKVQGSCAAGQAGTTGSLQRFVNISSNTDVMYDSYPPSVVEVLNTVGSGFYKTGGGNPITYLAFGNPSSVSGKKYTDVLWYLRSAYEISSNRYTSISYEGLRGNAYTSTNVLSQEYLTSPFSARIFQPELDGTTSAAVVDDNGNLNNLGAFRNSIKYAYGFGDAAYNLPSPKQSAETVIPVIRGYKYGLAGLFGTYSSTRFRRDHYGQFRDMFEQPPNAAYLIGNSVSYPVEIQFYARPNRDGSGALPTEPMKTHSQNLSNFATSSLPYYDGNTVERSDDPDETIRDLFVG